MKVAIIALMSLLPNALKIILFRIIGFEIDKKVKIGFGAVINSQGKVKLKSGSVIGPFTYIRCTDLNMESHSKIAALTYIDTPVVHIGKDSLISSFVIVRSGHVSKQSALYIGDIVHVFPFVTIDCSKSVYIGDETGIGPHCSIFTHGSYKSVLDGNPVTYGDVTIGKNVELSYSVFVAPGVTIGDNAVCAYGSYINKDVPDGVLAAGMPAIVKRTKDQINESRKIPDVKQALSQIIREYTENITFVNKKKPQRIILSVSGEVVPDTADVIYLIYDTKVHKTQASGYGLFDISNQLCVNNGIHPDDFNDFRKYLSRYGIRFITKTDEDL